MQIHENPTSHIFRYNDHLYEQNVASALLGTAFAADCFAALLTALAKALASALAKAISLCSWNNLVSIR